MCSEVSEYGMPYCVRLLQARHLAAEAVAAVADGHLRRGVRRGLHQHRHVQVRRAQRVGDGALVAEIRQRDDDAVDLVAMLPEQRRALPRLVAAFDRAVLRLLGVERDHAEPGVPMAAIISSRPLLARWSGKKPRLPTIMPNVIGCGVVLVMTCVSTVRSASSR